MSIIQQNTDASLSDNWRTINIDALDPESSQNFPLATLSPASPPVSLDEIRSVGAQIRQLLRGGDALGALSGALQFAPYGGDETVKEEHGRVVMEVLQGVRSAEIAGVVRAIYKGDGGGESLDALMKYL